MTKKSLPLEGLVVVERSLSIAGAFAGRQLADAGATVHVVRPAAPEWWAQDVSQGLRTYLDADKILVADAGTGFDEFARLAAAADIVVWEAPTPPAADEIDRIGADRVLAIITARGLTGPRSDLPWTEFTLQAESASLHMRGDADREPIQAGGEEALWLTGAATAAAVLAGLSRGESTIIDVPILALSHTAFNNFTDIAASLANEPHTPRVMRRKLAPSIEPAADGWVGFNLASAQNLEDFMVLIERPDMLDDPELRSAAGRYARVDEWNEAVHAWTTRHTVAEIVELATVFRIPVAQVNDGRTILENEHVVDREFFRPAPDGVGVQPAAPFLFDGERAGADRGAARAVPLAGIDTTPRRADFDDPLAEVRVADFGSWWAGALNSEVLACFGADIIKIESARRIDGARTMLGVLRPIRPERWWELGQHYLALNHNKRNVALDMTRPEGLDLVREIIRRSDVLIENYAPRVMESLGLDWDGVRQLNPRIVMVRQPAYGLTGPLRDQIGYAQTVEQFSGQCARTGYPDRTPLNPNGVADPTAAFNAAFATLAALRAARRRGTGMFVESALVESAIVTASEQAVHYSRTGEVLGRHGNHSERAVPQGVYPVAGEEQWMALSVVTDAQWQALAELGGDADWAEDERFRTAEGRRTHRAELDEALAAWSAAHEGPALAAQLQQRGVAAAMVVDSRFAHEDPQMEATGFYEWVDHAVAGRIALPTMPFRVHGIDRWSRTPPATLGQHTAEVLEELLGMSRSEVDGLFASGVSGAEPANR